MKHGEMNLGSIINAAKTMAMPKEKSPFFRRAAAESSAAGLKNQNSDEKEPPVLSAPPSDTADTPKAVFPSGISDKTEPETVYSKNTPDIHTVGVHFLEFAVAFLTLSKCQYQHSSSLKVSSLPFFTLVALDNWAEEDYTMSELAEKLQITKQQLSRMINVLEEKGLVERIHDRENRRRVYIRICDSGRQMMDSLKQEMLESTLLGLRPYTPDELSDMDSCICRLTELMGKFNTDLI